MAQVSIKFGDPALVMSGGDLIVNLDDGSQMTFSGATGLQEEITSAIQGGNTALRMLAIAHRFAGDPLLDSPEHWDGVEVVIDPEQADPADVFQVIEPE